MTAFSLLDNRSGDKPRLLDLFCCSGGAGVGYDRAGFEVVGVDISPQPHYPFEFIQGDALEVLERIGGEFDAIHASPPCQRFTPGARQHGTQDSHPDLIEPTRSLLRQLHKPYVIENVPAAPLLDPTLLCGSMFDLSVEWEGERRELRRHRIFETNFPLQSPGPCRHRHRAVTVAGNPGGRSVRDGISFPNADAWREVMGMPWATAAGLAQAIPPAYSEYIGTSLLDKRSDVRP